MRHSRQEILIGKESQKKLEKSKITIVGLGALGTVAAELLTRSGVNNITLVDRDLVELTNLQRQVLFTEKDIGTPKVQTAKQALEKIDSQEFYNFTLTAIGFMNSYA